MLTAIKFGEAFGGFRVSSFEERRVYRGNSLIRNCTLPRTTGGP
jgi:hypothetical protein